MWASFGPSTGLEALELWPLAATDEGILVGSAGKGVFLQDQDRLQNVPRIFFEPTLANEGQVVLRWRALAYEARMDADRIQKRTALDDGPWSAWSTKREATFHGFERGTHQLRVQATGSAGLHSDEPAIIEFNVLPSLYSRPLLWRPVRFATEVSFNRRRSLCGNKTILR
jgi:hypothetical protein